jgi:transcriptional regulator with XRE-family HTH domain
MLAKILADRLRQLREEKGWSQGQLTTYSGVSKGQVSKIEKGDRKYPSAPVIMKLAKALDTTTDYLLGLTDDPRRPAERDYETVAEGINNLIDKAAEIRRHLKGEGGASDEAGRG